MAMVEVTVALDWTPNTNHVGFYVAKALGLYSEQGLAVKFLSPHSDNYTSTPAGRVATKEASEFSNRMINQLVAFDSFCQLQFKFNLISLGTLRNSCTCVFAKKVERKTLLAMASFDFCPNLLLNIIDAEGITHQFSQSSGNS